MLAGSGNMILYQNVKVVVQSWNAVFVNVAKREAQAVVSVHSVGGFGSSRKAVNEPVEVVLLLDLSVDKDRLLGGVGRRTELLARLISQHVELKGRVEDTVTENN